MSSSVIEPTRRYVHVLPHTRSFAERRDARCNIDSPLSRMQAEPYECYMEIASDRMAIDAREIGRLDSDSNPERVLI